MNRRDALARLSGMMAMGWLGTKTAIAAEITTGSAATTTTAAAQIAAQTAASGKPFTIAHITDVHIFAKLNAQKWFAHCLHHIQSHSDKPSLILNTGDSVMETLNVDRAGADNLWKIWSGVLNNENSLPIRHCLGNHDKWALDLNRDHPAKKDPMYGNGLAMDYLGMEKPYYSFDHGDWHFIALDSIFPTGEDKNAGWTAKLDDEQFRWLAADLAATPADRPVAVYSHVSILTVTSMLKQKPGENGYNFGPQAMMEDARRIIDLFAKHPNVKLCLSGHRHLLDRIELGGVTYICDGAVSGEWWKGPRMKCPPGYSLLTFKPDGSFDYKYTGYDWKSDPLA